MLFRFRIVLILLTAICFGQLASDAALLAQALDRQDYGCYQKGRRQFLKVEPLDLIELPSQTHFDVTYYAIDLDITHVNTEIIYGRVTMQARSLIDNLITVHVHLANSMTVEQVSGDANAFSHNVTGGGLNSYIEMTLDGPRNIGDMFEVVIDYHGHPLESGFQAFAFEYQYGNPNNHRIISTLSEPYGARTWWPCKDIPADKADSVDIWVQVPANDVVSSNGVLRSTTINNDNTITYYWHEGYPITTYLVSLAISNYQTGVDYYVTAAGDSMPVYVYAYPQVFSIAVNHFSPTVNMITAMAPLLGEYPFLNEKYGNTMFPWGGAMEHQTNTSYGENLIYHDYYQPVVMHELGHQWFGDLISPAAWNHIWLNEGFASYTEALWAESVHGFEAYKQWLQSQVYMGDGTIYVPDDQLESIGRIFHGGLSYDKGSWVLNMLRHVVGDSAFFASLQAYTAHPDIAYGTATTEQFRDVVESVSGMDLDWFFEQWIYGEYYPFYRWGWNQSQIGPNEYQVRVLIQQSQLWQLFKMPVDLKFNYANGQSQTVTAWDSLSTQTFHFTVNSPLTSVELDPDNWILHESTQIPVDVEGDQTDVYPYFLDQNYPNPSRDLTTIYFQLPIAEKVELAVYNINGQLVRTLLSAVQGAGGHAIHWDGKNENEQSVSDGVYFYQMTTAHFSATKSMLRLGD